ncbi:MAG: RNA polymerase sigma factor [Gammaproteobacteria bacterium]
MKRTGNTNQTDLERELRDLHEKSFHWALSCCKWDYHEAEEVLQNCYLKVLDGRAIYNHESGIKTWFFAVIRKTSKELARKRIIRRLGLSRFSQKNPAAGETGETDSTAGAIAALQAQYRIKAALSQLSGRQRELLELVFYQDLTIQQAATVIGISTGSARVHYERGKRNLRALLEPGDH